MGSGSWSPTDWTNYSTKTQTKTQSQVFSQRSLHKDMDPNGVAIRESRDSDDHPESNAIIIALDETGSMGYIPEKLCKTGLGTLVEETLSRQPVKDPQIMFIFMGDAYTDNSPLQVGQFESDISMTQWLEKGFLEGNGGGNGGESYLFPWYFAAMHTSIDCFEKRQKKGYLFTIGDENCHAVLTKDQIKRITGDDVERDYTSQELLTLAQRTYHVYHIMITESGSCDAVVQRNWRQLLGERAIALSDYTKLPELIVSTIQINSGSDVQSVVSSWSGNTSLVIADAVKGLAATSDTSGVVRL